MKKLFAKSPSKFYLWPFWASTKRKISSLATTTTAAAVSQGISFGKQKSGTVKMALVVLDADEGFDERKKD